MNLRSTWNGLVEGIVIESEVQRGKFFLLLKFADFI